MPLYEYRCLQCGKVTEILARTSKEGPCPCSFCGSADTEKMVSVTGILRSGARKTGDKTCCGESQRCDHPRCEETGHCTRD